MIHSPVGLLLTQVLLDPASAEPAHVQALERPSGKPKRNFIGSSWDPQTCRVCKGSGTVPCSKCKGKGFVKLM